LLLHGQQTLHYLMVRQFEQRQAIKSHGPAIN
jgi:hypothetical protein